MGGPVEEAHAYSGYLNPTGTWTYAYLINNWSKKAGSDAGLSLAYPYQPFFTTNVASGLSSGNYKIVYGGGRLNFISGKKMKVQLWVATSGYDWYIADDYEINNPNASDGQQCNFADGYVDLPLRSTTVYLYNTWVMAIELQFNYQYENLDWENELGAQFNTKQQWIDGGSPGFGVTAGYVCSPRIRSDLCGSNLYPGNPNNSWFSYYYSNAYMKNLNSYGDGVIDGVSLDIYKVD